MILVDTGPLIALFEPLDPHHSQCVETLKRVEEHLITCVPVLTEAFHLLGPGTQASRNVRRFIQKGGVKLFALDRARLDRAFSLMETYSDHPMDLADASLVAAGEYLDTHKIFTVDRKDFEAYKIAKGYTFHSFQIVS